MHNVTVIFHCSRSVLRVLNEQGDTQNSYSYDPFGNVLQQSEKVRNLFLYVGKFGVIRDEELNSIYMMRVRHYDAGHGRYISLDPLGEPQKLRVVSSMLGDSTGDI